MSKILGIIAEYNPLHNGHIYHIQESQNKINADYTICIMTGNFTQRGEAAQLDKWSRAKMALEAGIDLVIELPLIYSISSAENFSFGCINIFEQLKIVNTLSFGSECGDINILKTISKILCEEPKEYVSILNHELSTGISFPKAREKALLMYLNDIRKYANVLSGSNNILGIEYLKTLAKQKSKITPITIKRKYVEHTDNNKIINGFASGSAIRQNIYKPSYISKAVPEESFNIIDDKIKHGQIISGLKSYEKEIIFKLRTMPIEEIAKLADVTEGLENLIKKSVNNCNNIDDLINLIKSKRYTQTRLQRIMLYALFNITKEDMENSKKGVPYIRILGMNENGKNILATLSKSNKKINIITSPKAFMDKCNNKIAKSMFEKDILASNIYTLGYEFNSQSNLDYTKPFVTI